MLRLKRSLSERIYLLAAKQVSEEEWNFRVRGQSNNIYEQVLKPEEFSCSCPDHQKNNNFCKHLLFLIARVAMQMEVAGKISDNKKNWKTTAFEACSPAWLNRLKNRISGEKTKITEIKAIGSDCPICFEEMKSGDNLVECVTTCHNYFHRDCMNLWLSENNTCALCRSRWKKVAGDVIFDEEPEVEVELLEKTEESRETKTDIVFSFDTTGSMSSCIRDVRRNIEKITAKMFEEIPGLRLGIIAHGDYCDEEKTISILDFTDDREAIQKFVREAPDTYGGDYPECYELVLMRALQMGWRSDATMKSLVMIGDAVPHEKNENPFKIDWREEAEKLANRNVQIFSVQCLNNGGREEFKFYSTIARMTNGYHLFLDQFSYIKDMIQAICYKQYDQEQLVNFEAEVQRRDGGMNSQLRLMFDTILGKKSRDEVEAEMHPDRFRERYHRGERRSGGSAAAVPTLEGETELHPCPPTKFQVFVVDDDIGIKDFCESMSIRFAKGRGFYEFIKPEIIQPQKEIVSMDRETGDLYEGEVARRIAGIGRNDERAKIKPGDLPKYRIFIQSTSVNRKLLKNQGFLYEVSR